MGGGASKSDDKVEPANKAGQGGNDASKDRGAGAANATEEVAVARGLICTVTDAVANTQIAFQSSVAAVKPKRGRRTSIGQQQAAAAVVDDSASDLVIRHVESIIITGSEVTTRSTGGTTATVTSPTTSSAASTAGSTATESSRSVAQMKQQQILDRGSWRSSLGVLEPVSSSPELLSMSNPRHASPVGVLVGGAFVATGVDQPQPRNPAAAAGDDKAKAAQLRASLIASKTRFAAPTNFSLTTCGGQSGAIRAIASNSEGTQFASVVAASKTSQCFDAASGRIIMEIKGHTDPIVAIGHSRDGKFLLTSSADGTVCMWDLNNGKKLREIGVNSQANSVAISDDSDTVATSSTEDFVNLWESKNGDALTLFQRHSGAVYCVAFSRRGNLVASGSQNGEVYVWGAQVGDVRHHIDTGARAPVLAVSFSYDGSRLVTTDRDVLQVWDLFTGGLVLTRNGAGEAMQGEQGRQMHTPTTFSANKESPRITAASFAACNTIVVGLTTRRVIVVEPNLGTELLSVELRALVTCLSVNWAGDVVFIGDFAGNHYRLQMSFSHKAVMDYNLNSKPPAKERGKEKD